MSIDLDGLEGLAKAARGAVSCTVRDALAASRFRNAMDPETVLSLIAAARERDGLREQARLDGEAMQAAIDNIAHLHDGRARMKLEQRLEARQSIAPNAGEPK